VDLFNFDGAPFFNTPLTSALPPATDCTPVKSTGPILPKRNAPRESKLAGGAEIPRTCDRSARSQPIKWASGVLHSRVRYFAIACMTIFSSSRKASS
jgi:hypothetical protein